MWRTRVQRRHFALGLVLLAAAPAWGQETPTARVRGTIESIDGSTLTVKVRDGSELKVVLPDDARIVGIVKATVADIKSGSFVGVTGMPQADGTQRAVEVHIFPEAMRGTGEGHRAWDLLPQSTMTNGNVDQTVVGVNGQTLTVSYKGGEKKIVLTPQTTIVSYAPADRSELKPGMKIFVAAAKKQPDGTLLAPRLNFGRDGLTPPM